MLRLSRCCNETHMLWVKSQMFSSKHRVSCILYETYWTDFNEFLECSHSSVLFNITDQCASADQFPPLPCVFDFLLFQITYKRYEILNDTVFSPNLTVQFLQYTCHVYRGDNLFKCPVVHYLLFLQQVNSDVECSSLCQEVFYLFLFNFYCYTMSNIFLLRGSIISFSGKQIILGIY